MLITFLILFIVQLKSKVLNTMDCWVLPSGEISWCDCGEIEKLIKWIKVPTSRNSSSALKFYVKQSHN